MKLSLRKGQVLFHKESKAKIMFAGWQNDQASCFDVKTKAILSISRADLETQYQSYSALERQAREKRRGQGW